MADSSANAGADVRPGTQPSALAPPVTPAMLVVWHARRELQWAFDIRTPRGRRDFAEWFALVAAAGSGVGLNIPPRAAGPGPLARARRGLARTVARMPTRIRRAIRASWHATQAVRAAAQLRLARRRGRRPPACERAVPTPTAAGVRIVGSIRGESGMGHSLRSFAAACRTAAVPVALVESGVRNPSRTVPTTGVASSPDADTLRGNVLYMPAAQVGDAIVALGERSFRDRTNILVPFWELARCPEAWRHVARFVDEIWAPTRFVEEAFSTLSPHVIRMPPCVPEPAPAPLGRAHFGLPQDAFVFFFSFDFHSFPERKNPLAVVAAFREAFPTSTAAAALVLHAMNADLGSPYWRRLERAAGADPRIRLSTALLTHAEVLGLCAACDCYVSLHRAEGFGYGPAEAMLLGKPAILTGYSGPCDYAGADDACLVDFSLVGVRPDQYVHHEGCVWAEPDIGHAAWHMRRLAASPTLAADVGRRGRDAVRARHAAEIVGATYLRRFRELGILDDGPR